MSDIRTLGYRKAIEGAMNGASHKGKKQTRILPIPKTFRRNRAIANIFYEEPNTQLSVIGFLVSLVLRLCFDTAPLNLPLKWNLLTQKIYYLSFLGACALFTL